ncbi:MAG: precorrin-2 dehydrogenase/sirohydrochlorin ferrochelatase family protein [Nitrososphaerales archaeon]
MIIIATNDSRINKEIFEIAKKTNALICSVDDPSISNFTFPAIAKIGDVQIAISARGKSPLMERTIRKRVERMIKKEDISQIELQSSNVNLAKSSI